MYAGYTHPVGFRGGTCGHRQLVSKKRIVRTQNLVFSNPLGGVLPPVLFFSRSEQGEWGVPTTPRNSRKKQRHPSTCTCNVQL